MSMPVHFKTRPPICPIGDRPAVCLTQYLPHDERANVLTLNCGDPRDILFTIHSRLVDTPREEVCNLDFTSCESDETVQARNVLIFTLLADSTEGNAVQNSKIWNICYDLLIDGASASLLYHQAFKLRKRTQSLEQWNMEDNEYNQYIRMCSNDTVERLRGQFDVYEKAKHYSKSQKKRFKDKFKSRMEECRQELSISHRHHPGTGSFWSKAKATIAKLRELYWLTGTTTRDENLHDHAILPNPTLASDHTSPNFALLVNSGVHPVDGFNVSPTYIHSRWKEDGPSSNEHELDADGKDTEPAEIRIAKRQFFEWAESFRKAVKWGKLKIRIAVADPISMCIALSHLRDGNPPDYLSPWNAKTFIIEDPDYANTSTGAPIQFDSIDTGMLADTMGYLNVILITRFLMFQASWSSLRTRTSWSSVPNSFSREQMWNLLMDPNLFGIILQLLPVAHMTGYSAESDANEVCRINAGHDAAMEGVESIAWKYVPQDKNPLSVDPQALAYSLNSLFLGLCQPELRGETATIDKTYQQQSIKPFYTPGSFAALLALVKERITPPVWDRAFEDFLGRQQENPFRLIYQELLTQLDIYELKGLVPLDSTSDPTPPATPTESETECELVIGPRLFEDWKEVREKVCVTLIVPTEMIDEFEASCKAADRHDPILLVQIEGPEIHQFSCIFPVRAHARRVSFQMIPFVELDETSKGPLTISVWIPTSLINDASPGETKIRLVANANWRAERPDEYENKSLYETNFSNSSAVLISSERPNMFRDLQRIIGYYALMGKKIEPLSPSSQPWGKENAWKPTEISLDKDMNVLGYRFWISQVQGAQGRARKGQLISVPFKSVVISSTTDDDGTLKVESMPVKAYRFDEKFPNPLCFPMRFMVLDNRISWGIHYLNLDCLPAIDIQTARVIPNLRKYWEATYDAGELMGRHWEDVDVFSGYQGMKYTTWTMFKLFTDTTLPPATIFNLTIEGTEDSWLVLFVNDLRLDLGNNSMVLDCDLLLVSSPEMGRKVKSFLAQMEIQRVHVVNHPVPASERWCWLAGGYTAVITERCRTWTHKQNCNLVKDPYGIQVPYLCSCSAGRHSPAFAMNPKWKPFRSHVTRAAISPIFDWPENPTQKVAFSRAITIKGIHLLKFGASTPTNKRRDILPELHHLCDTCGMRGSMRCCQRCLQTWFCSPECELEGMEKYHGFHCDTYEMLMNENVGGEGKKKKKKKKKKKRSGSVPAGAGSGYADVVDGDEVPNIEDLTPEVHRIKETLLNGNGSNAKKRRGGKRKL